MALEMTIVPLADPTRRNILHRPAADAGVLVNRGRLCDQPTRHPQGHSAFDPRGIDRSRKHGANESKFFKGWLLREIY
jgi:hypothetical protein